MNLTIGNKDYGKVTVDYLAQMLRSITEQYSEIWLTHADGPSLCCLKNGNDAFLMYLRFEGDSGYVSFSPERSQTDFIDFILANGQKDSYPKAQAVSYDEATSACEKFWFTKEMDRRLQWLQV